MAERTGEPTFAEPGFADDDQTLTMVVGFQVCKAHLDLLALVA